jgi:hypothetical protein
MSNNQRRRDELQRLVDDLWFLFTETGPKIRARFGESQLTNDHNRINYALELMDVHVSQPVRSTVPA